MKKSTLKIGIAAIVLPVPILILTSFWAYFCAWVIGIGLLHHDPGDLPQWSEICSFLPLLISPALGIWGIVRGIRMKKEKHARLGILLSVLALLENALLIYGMYYLGSRF